MTLGLASLHSRALLCAWLALALCASGCAAGTPPVDAAEEAMFAGRADDGQTFLSVVRNGTSFLIYGCDDARDAWFRAESLVSPMELTNDAGASLLLAMGDEEATGELRFAEDDAPITFALARTEEQVLFRADGRVSGEPLVGGWIRLPDGEQRGVIARRTDRTASRVRIDASGARVDGAFADRLAPAAFTPARLAAPTRARAVRFDLYAMGDSYGAGEAAPEVPGDYRDDGTLEDDGEREEWDASLTTEAARREARACHRSGISGIERAAEILRAEYGSAVDLRLASFACSGSQTEHLHSCAYRGAIGDHFTRSADFVRPQLDRVREASRFEGVDAVYMSIGGNDMQFGTILASCLREGILGEGVAGDVCGSGSPIDRLSRSIAEGTGSEDSMQQRYRIIADELLGLVPRHSDHVYISQYPNPLVDADGNPCEEVDILRFGGLGRIGGDEIVWLADTVVSRLNTAVSDAAAAHGWSLVSDHVSTFLGHGYCSRDPWFADNPASLRAQGRGMTDALDAGTFPRDMCMSPSETAEEPGPVGGATIAGGIVHPDADGYALGYGPAIAERMREQLEDHVRPLPVTGLRIQAQERSGGVELAWDDRASNETEYRVTVVYEEGAGLPSSDMLVLPADSRTFELPLSVRSRGTASVTACFVGPRPARREVCSAASSIRWSNSAPTRPIMDARVDTSRRAPVRDLREMAPAQQLVRVVWTPSDEPGVVYYDVELLHTDGSARRIATTDSALIVTAQVSSARVRACNFIDCTDPSREAAGPGCAAGQIVAPDGRCAAGATASGLDPLELACRELSRDPAGICTRR